jgi:hypothetical protein
MEVILASAPLLAKPTPPDIRVSKEGEGHGEGGQGSAQKDDTQDHQVIDPEAEAQPQEEKANGQPWTHVAQALTVHRTGSAAFPNLFP